MKISLITACYNSAATIRTAIESVLSQKGVDVEYIVVDGGSTDGTVDIIKEYAAKTNDQRLTTNDFTFKWISERDRGMYDAINKGIKMATGDVVGILNADDVLATDDTLAKIAAAFEGAGVRSQGLGVRVSFLRPALALSFVDSGSGMGLKLGSRAMRLRSDSSLRIVGIIAHL